MGRWVRRTEYGSIMWRYFDKGQRTKHRITLSPYPYSKIQRWQVIVDGPQMMEPKMTLFRTKRDAENYVQKYKRRNPNG